MLPVLHGDRLVAKADVKAERRAGVLRVPALHMEPGTSPDDRDAARMELRLLADWLNLRRLTIERTFRTR